MHESLCTGCMCQGSKSLLAAHSYFAWYDLARGEQVSLAWSLYVCWSIMPISVLIYEAMSLYCALLWRVKA